MIFEEKWILTFESIIRECLHPINFNLLENNEYFKILQENDVKFYDKTTKAKPLRIKGLTEEYAEEEHPEEKYLSLLSGVKSCQHAIKL